VSVNSYVLKKTTQHYLLMRTVNGNDGKKKNTRQGNFKFEFFIKKHDNINYEFL